MPIRLYLRLEWHSALLIVMWSSSSNRPDTPPAGAPLEEEQPAGEDGVNVMTRILRATYRDRQSYNTSTHGQGKTNISEVRDCIDKAMRQSHKNLQPS